MSDLKLQLILLVNPDITMTDELAFALQHLGFKVVSTVDARQALTEIYKRPPDIIIIDEGSCGYNGEGLCHRMKDVCSAPIIVTGHDQKETDGIDLLKMGANVYLPSPLSLNELFSRVRTLLRHSNEDLIEYEETEFA